MTVRTEEEKRKLIAGILSLGYFTCQILGIGLLVAWAYTGGDHATQMEHLLNALLVLYIAAIMRCTVFQMEITQLRKRGFTN